MGGGNVKGQLSLRPVGTFVVRERMRKALQRRVAAHCQWVGAPAPLGRGQGSTLNREINTIDQSSASPTASLVGLE